MGLQVNTSAVAPAERFDYWSSSASQVIHPMSLDREDPRQFSGRMHVSRVGQVDIFHITGDALTVSRTARLIRMRDPAQLNLVDLVRGSCRVRQQDRATVIAPGELCAHSTSQPYTYCAETPFELLLFGIPRSMLGPAAGDIFAATATTVTGCAGEVATLGRDFLRNLAFGLEDGRVDPHTAGLADCIAALTRSLYGNAGAEVLSDTAESIVPQLLAYIDARLGEPDLGPRSIAAAHFISVRYLHKLFQRRGLTVAGYIRHTRLEQCRRSLADPRCRTLSVAQIARQWGMADLPSFSRRFRAEFDESPREYRARRLCG